MGISTNESTLPQAAGVLYLLPTYLTDSPNKEYLPPISIDLAARLDSYIVENTRSARRFISSLKIQKPIDSITFFEFNKENPLLGLKDFLHQNKNKEIGIMSEAGCPCIADPGMEAVKIAHEMGIMVIPIPGPSSIILSLMGSGFNGQSFAFHGYLPIEKSERQQALIKLEVESQKKKQTQIFIETPYRNNAMMATIMASLRPETKLCIAANLTQEDQFLKTKTIRLWQGQLPDLNKIPAIFLISAS